MGASAAISSHNPKMTRPAIASGLRRNDRRALMNGDRSRRTCCVPMIAVSAALTVAIICFP